MKNLKKVLALAVAFVMCFTMFAGAAVFSDVPAGGDYSAAISFLSDLQVIAGKPDGTFGVNDAITRADAACLIARMMTGQMNPPKYDNHVAFSDVEVGSYYESAVGYCAALGITSGTGNGMFSPKRTITDGEFIAMVTRALGYDTAANPLSYPMGNIVVAEAKGLLEGVNPDYASDALRGEDAQILYNAVFADYDREAANKNLYQASDDHYSITIAEAVFDLGRLSHDARPQKDISNVNHYDQKLDYDLAFHGANKNKTWECDAHTWVIAGVDARNAENTFVAFAIDDSDEKAISPEKKADAWSYQEFTYDGADISKMLGYRVELWGEIDHSGAPWEVTAIKILDGQAAYDYNAGMYTDDKKVKVEDKTLYINDRKNVANMAKINLDLDTAAKSIWATEDADKKTPYENTFAKDGAKFTDNTDAYRLATVTAGTGINPANNTQVNMNFADGDQYKLIDWDSDDYIDFVVCTTYKYGEVKSVTKSRVVLEVEDRANGTRGEYSLKLGEDDLVVTGADSIKEGDVVEISVTSREFKKSDDEVVTINLATVAPESKKLEKINLTKDTYVMDGEEVTFADPDLFDLVEETESRNELRTVENIGQQFNVWFDRNGFILKVEVSDETAHGYLMVLDTVDGNMNLNGNVKRGNGALDVLFDDNTIGEEIPVVRDLKIDGSDERNGYSRTGAYNGRLWNQYEVVGNVYKYYMNSDGEITRMESQTKANSVWTGNYNYDESKNRISVRTVDGLTDIDNAGRTGAGIPVDNQTRTNRVSYYGLDDDAVVFAVKKTGTDADKSGIADGRGLRGYVQVSALTDNNVTTYPNVLAGAGVVAPNVRYFVDPEDVIAVKVGDIPEIDNRWTVAKGWSVADPEVTHPSTFVDEDKNNADNGVNGVNAAANGESAQTTVFMNRAPGEAAKNESHWMQWVNNGDYANDDTIWNSGRTEPEVNPAVIAANRPIVDAEGKPVANNTNYVVPSAVLHTNRDTDVDVAILGVDDFDYFGQATVKLALITDVSAIGGKSYEIEGAVDGKVGAFKTISGYEEDIFKGRIGGAANSLQAMQSYLNLNLNQYPTINGDAFKGSRNGLYAEVTMNSEGLITQIRAMDVVTSPTFWGNDTVTTTFMQGNVYRVIRGVSEQLRSNKYVTWQASPTAANEDDYYPMSKNADNNGYDHLEAAYDDATHFYKIDQKPRMIKDVRTWIDLGFRDNLTGEIEVADSGVLAASTFIEEGNGSDYYTYDFAVYKNNLDKLAGVFAFKSVSNVSVRTALALDVSETAAATPSNMRLKVEVIKTHDASIGVPSTDPNLDVVYTQNGVETPITFKGTDGDEAATLKALRDKLLLADGATDADGDDVPDAEDNNGRLFNDISAISNGAFIITANDDGRTPAKSDVIGLTDDLNTEVTGYEIRVTEIPATTVSRNASISITVPNGQYKIGRTTIKYEADNGAAQRNIEFDIPAGSYSSVEIAAFIEDQLAKQLPDDCANATVIPHTGHNKIHVGRGLAEEIATQTNPGNQNVVTVVDYTIGNGEMDVTLSPITAKTLVPATPVD